MSTTTAQEDALREQMLAARKGAPSKPSTSTATATVEARESRTWEQVLEDLRTTLDSDRVCIEDVHAILDSYNSNYDDWKQYAHFNDHCYTRNLVDVGNGKYNLMLLCWDMGQASAIHDHAGSHCFMKILDGSLVEEVFGTPDDIEQSKGQPLDPVVEAEHETDGVLYMSDRIGTHRVSNPSHARRAVSLHLYSPPYSECHCFDERTGTKNTSGTISFFSEFGEVTSDQWQSGVAAKADAC